VGYFRPSELVALAISNEKNADIEASEVILRQIREGMKKSGW